MIDEPNVQVDWFVYQNVIINRRKIRKRNLALLVSKIPYYVSVVQGYNSGQNSITLST